MDYAHRGVYPPPDLESSMEAPPPYQPKYVMLNSHSSTNLRPPHQRRNVPRYHSSHQRISGENFCLKCVCCCFCFWFVLIIILATAIVALYSYLQPEIPHYNVDSFNVNAFNVQKDFGLYTEFVVTVKSDNPNQHIAIEYGKEGSVVVTYRGSPLCTGKIPAFHQPYLNTTMIPVTLKGKSEFGSGLQEALMQNRNSGKIPLLVQVKAPVSIMVQDYPLRQITVLLNCSLVVDNLSPNKKARILSSTYQYALEL